MPSMRRSTVILALLVAVWVVLYLWPATEPVAVTPGLGVAPATRGESSAAAAPPAAERTGVGVPAAAPEGALGTAATAATPTGGLRVLVRSEGGAALAGCRVDVAEHEATTDAAGEAIFTVAVGRAFVSVQPPAGQRLTPRSGWQTVRAGATAELLVVLAAPVESSFWCRLLAAEDQKPLAGVDVKQQPEGRLLRSDRDGYVQCAADAMAFLDVAVAERAPCRVIPVPEHATREQALVVAIAPGAVVRVKVVDGGGAPVSHVRVELSAMAFLLQQPEWQPVRGPAFTWSGQSDAAGALVLAAVPLAVTLEMTATAQAPFAAPLPQRWSFAQRAEERTLTVSLAGGVSGRVLDAAGQPVAEAVVQANEPDGDQLPRALPAVDDTRRARTASDGSFRIMGLAAGRWWVGLAAGGAWQPTAQPVEIAVGRDTAIELRAAKGLAVAGTALAVDGTPCRGVDVELYVDQHLFGSSHSDGRGAFRFVNVPAGPGELRTAPYATDFGLAAPLGVQAGDEQILLRLVAVAGSLAGRCVGSTDAWVSAHRRGGEDAIAMRCELDGSFCYEGMRAGVWDVTAFDRSARVAWVAAVQVPPGRATTGLLLDLQPGGELRLRHARADAFAVRRGDDVAATDALEPGVPGRVVVPAGAYTVVFLHAGREVARRDVTVGAGERLSVDGS